MKKLTWDKSLSLPGERERRKTKYWAYKKFTEETNIGTEGGMERVRDHRARERESEVLSITKWSVERVLCFHFEKTFQFKWNIMFTLHFLP